MIELPYKDYTIRVFEPSHAVWRAVIRRIDRAKMRALHGNGGALVEITISSDQFTKEDALDYAKQVIDSGTLLLAEPSNVV